MMTLVEYHAAVDDRRYSHPDERAGQRAFNVLVENRPDLSEQVRGTDLDPFYNNANLYALFGWLYDNWTEEPNQP